MNAELIIRLWAVRLLAAVAERKERRRARLAAVPITELQLGSKAGMREYRRRMNRLALITGGSWDKQTGKPVNKPNALRNVPGFRQRRRWVPHQPAASR